MKFAALLVSIFIFPISSNADLMWDLHATLLNDTFTYSTNQTQSVMVYGTSLNFVLNKSKSFYVGWGVFGLTQSLNDGTTTNSFATLDMGPRFTWVSKTGMFQFSASYNLRNATTYTEGSNAAVTLRGTSILVEFGVLPEISDDMRVGLKMIYYNPTWSESLEGTTQLTQVSYNRALMIPTLAFVWQL